jgi:hypothetical protein
MAVSVISGKIVVVNCIVFKLRTGLSFAITVHLSGGETVKSHCVLIWV